MDRVQVDQDNELKRGNETSALAGVVERQMQLKCTTDGYFMKVLNIKHLQ